MLAFTVGLAIHLGYQKHLSDQRFRQSERNFYGVLRVRDIPPNEEDTAVRRLIHGTINHGEQLLDAKRRDEPTSYYGPYSGMGRAMGYLQKRGPVRVAVIGLGAGVTASFCRAGDFFRFYEINPLALVHRQHLVHFSPRLPGRSPGPARRCPPDARNTAQPAVRSHGRSTPSRATPFRSTY